MIADVVFYGAKNMTISDILEDTFEKCQCISIAVAFQQFLFGIYWLGARELLEA